MQHVKRFVTSGPTRQPSTLLVPSLQIELEVIFHRSKPLSTSLDYVQFTYEVMVVARVARITLRHKTLLLGGSARFSCYFPNENASMYIVSLFEWNTWFIFFVGTGGDDRDDHTDHTANKEQLTENTPNNHGGWSKMW